MSTLDRRELLRLAAATGVAAGLAGATAGLAGCASPAVSGQPIRLQYWSWLQGLQDVCDVWNAQRPDVQVEAVWMPQGNAGGYQKIFAALAAGGGPDMGQIEIRALPTFLLQDGLADLSRYGADNEAARYDEALFNQVRLLDRVWGLPQDSGPMVFFHRPDVLEAVGAQAPATWTEWLEVGRAMREADDTTWLESFSFNDASSFISYVTQAGATWFGVSEDRWVIDMTDDATLTVARFFDEAIDDGIVNTDLAPFSPGWFAAAADGKFGGVTSGSWADAIIKGTSGGEGLWRVAPMPTWDVADGYGSSYLGGSTVAVMSSCAYPEEALEFALWLTTDPAAIDAEIEFSGIGWSPTPDYIGADREGSSDFFGGQSYNEEVVLPAATQQSTDWLWPPATQEIINALSDNFRRKLTGDITLVDAVVATQDQAAAILRSKGLTVEVTTR